MSGGKSVKPEFQAPTSFPSEPKSIGLSIPSTTVLYSTYPEVALNAKLDDVRFAAVPPPPFIPVIEPVPSS